MPTNEELQRELETLRAELRQVRAQQDQAAITLPNKVLSRRNLLRAAPVVALGAGAAAMSATPAMASPGGAVIMGANNSAGTTTTKLTGGTSSTQALEVTGGLETDNLVIDDGVRSLTFSDTPQEGLVVAGWPNFSQNPALSVYAYAQPGGMQDNGWDGVVVKGRGGGNGVTVDWDDLGESEPQPHSPGTAVLLTTKTCDAVTVDTEAGQVINASVTSAIAALDAITVKYAGKGRSMYAESTLGTNVNGTITGVNDGAAGIGVWGEQRGSTGAGFGVVGVGGKLGRGARLSGGAANLQMLPSAATSHPTTGKAGDFFVDSTARLWYCQKASSGSTPATWKQLA